MSLALLAGVFVAAVASSSVRVVVEADSGRRAISPWIYGRNNSLSDDSAAPVASSRLAIYRAAGLRMLRETGGNNAPKYNWRKKLSSHPDWFNNVYAHDWDFAARTLQDSLPGTQGLFSFQLLGWAASSTQHNWDSWAWSQSHSAYPRGTFDLAGGGSVSSDGAAQLSAGNPSTYLEPWPADSSAGILGHWFGVEGIGLDSARFRYWNMDEEPECWSDIHDDVDSVAGLAGKELSPEDYVQRYVAVAKAVRARAPSLRLLGPVSANEWQWFNWPTGFVNYGGRDYCWPEYLIKRLGEHRDSTGERLLDVYDIHFYPGSGITSTTQQMQLHRIFWDTTWNYPSPSGVHRVEGGWDTAIKSEHVFGRIQTWLNTYLGPASEVGLAVTETGLLHDTSAPAASVWYASHLGLFADSGVEVFTPWEWSSGMWETLHLFTRYGKPIRVVARSDLDSLVSAYASLSSDEDSLTVVLVNRDTALSRTASVSLNGFAPASRGSSYRLAGLSGETFVSETENALRHGSVEVSSGSFALELPALSVTAVALGRNSTASEIRASRGGAWQFRRLGSRLVVTGLDQGERLEIIDVRGHRLRTCLSQGELLEVPLSGLPSGNFVLQAGRRTRLLAWMP